MKFPYVVKFVLAFTLATVIMLEINPWGYCVPRMEYGVPTVAGYSVVDKIPLLGDFIWGLSYVFGWMANAKAYVTESASVFNVYYPWSYALFTIVSASFLLFVIYFISGRDVGA